MAPNIFEPFEKHKCSPSGCKVDYHLFLHIFTELRLLDTELGSSKSEANLTQSQYATMWSPIRVQHGPPSLTLLKYMYHQVIRQVERGYMNNSAMFPVKSIDCGAFIQKKVEPLGLGDNGLVGAVLGIVRVGNSYAYS